MSDFPNKIQEKDRLGHLVKLGLIRELFRQQRITQSQFAQLMKIQRA